MTQLVDPGTKWLATVTFPHVDGVLKDRTQQKFVFDCVDGTDLTLLSGSILNFFNTAPTGSSRPMSQFMALSIDRGTDKIMIQWYDITGNLGVGATHGTPQFVDFFTLGVGGMGINDLPRTNALVLATNALPVGIRERGPVGTVPTDEGAQDEGAPPTHPGTLRLLSRTRGRMFLGPWNAGALSATADNVAAELLLIACNAAVDLIASTVASHTPWSVWSKADAVLRPIAHGYCEQKFGTQRRRREFQPVRSSF